MLTSLYQALMQLLSTPELPVFLADCVPEGTAFPYITAQIALPLLPAGEGSVTLTLWCRSNSANSERIALTDTLLHRLPARGMRIRLDSGAALLTLKNGADCVHSRDALGMRTVWALRCFPCA